MRLVRLDARVAIDGATNLTNMEIAKIGHSKLPNDPAHLHHWREDGLLDFLRAAAVERDPEVLGV